MRKFFNFFIPLLILGALIYQYWDILRERFLTFVPCATPISYNLGTFDEKFGISREYFLSALNDAEAVWEGPSKKNLFAYTPENVDKNILHVNLIYDYRQEATRKLSSLGIAVKDDRASYDRLKSKLSTLKAEYVKEKNIFDARLTAFNQKKQTYETAVKYWNDKGGADVEEYNKLESERLALTAESESLQNLEDQLNNSTDEINALVTALNRLIGVLNLSVDTYNTTNSARGESFEEGVYIQNGGSKEIDIYEFSNRPKLVRVLSHELGHALGLDHIDDREAIMYKFNQGNNIKLSLGDLTLLKAKCRLK